MKATIISIAFLLISMSGNAQFPWAYLNNTADPYEGGKAIESVFSTDGFILSAGTSGWSFNDIENMIVSKVDLDGNVIWINIYPYYNPYDGSAVHFDARNIFPLADGGALLAGCYEMGQDFLLIELDADGEVVWQTDSFMDTLEMNIGSLEPEIRTFKTPDDKVAAVYTEQFIHKSPYIRLMLIDPPGTLISDESISPHGIMGYSYTLPDYVVDVKIKPGGGFFYGGVKQFIDSLQEFFLIDFNNDLTLNWFQTYTISGEYGITDIIELADGNFLFSGTAFQNGSADSTHVVALKCSPTGEVLWTYTESITEDSLSRVMAATQKPDGSIVLLSRSGDHPDVYYNPYYSYGHELHTLDDATGVLTDYNRFKYSFIDSTYTTPSEYDAFLDIIAADDNEIILSGSLRRDIYYDPVNSYFTLIKSADGELPECIYNCVWPGDCNNDGIVNTTDVLSIGLAYGTEGIERNTTGNDWFPHQAAEWDYMLSESNGKYIDADGNGIINDDDTMAIVLNYGWEHPIYSVRTGSTLPELYFHSESGLLTTGWNTVDIILDDTGAELDIYGIAFSVALTGDTEIESGSLHISYDDCWIGTDAETLSMSKYFETLKIADGVITRTDQINVSGAGKIAELTFNVTDPGEEGITLTVLNSSAVIASGESLEILNGSLQLENPVVQSTTPVNNTDIFIYPNPANAQLWIETPIPAEATDLFLILDNLGREVMQMPLAQNAFITSADISRLADGLYIVAVIQSEHRFIEFLIIEN